MEKLGFTRCNEDHLKELVEMGRSTFETAFADMNNPEDFQIYLDEAFHENEILKQLKNRNSEFYFVSFGKNNIGYFKLNSEDSQTEAMGNNAIELERIYVIREFQGRGFGKEILEKVIEMGKNKMKHFLWLGVWQKNLKAIEFYKTHGFKIFDSHPYWVGKDKQTDWLMRLDLV